MWWRLVLCRLQRLPVFRRSLACWLACCSGCLSSWDYLLWLGWKRNGRLSLTRVLVYRHRLPRWQYPLYAVVTVAWGAVVTFAATPLESAISTTVFGWVPAGFTATTAADAASYSVYPRTILLITFGSLILINGVAAPIVEELYFRGYLMPRISRFGWKTPLLEDVLFALYHIWQPWAYVIILLTMTPTSLRSSSSATSTSESGRTCR